MKDNIIKRFSIWDWIVLISSSLLILAGLIFWNVEGLGLIFWGMIAGYFKFKKLKEIKFNK